MASGPASANTPAPLANANKLRRLKNAIAVSAQGWRVVNITLRIKGEVRTSILNSGTATGGRRCAETEEEPPN
jgi:hypothetical protein